MKAFAMKTSLILAIVFVQLSCSVKIPLQDRTQNLHHSSVKVDHPYFQKKTGDKRFWVGVSGVALGGALLYFAEKGKTTDRQGNLLSQQQINKKAEQGALLGALAGGVMGFSISYGTWVKYKLRPQVSTIHVNNTNFDEWLSKYNSKHNTNLAKYAQEGGNYTLVPKNQVREYEEATLYTKAMNKQLSIDNTFDKMLENCRAYLAKFPSGNHAKEVTALMEQINKIPENIRQSELAEMYRKVGEAQEKARRQQEEVRQQRLENTMGWLVIIGAFLFSGDGNHSDTHSHTTTCTYCYGHGKIYDSSKKEYIGPCSRCNGTGRVKD